MTGRAVFDNVGSVDVAITRKAGVPTLLKGALSGSATTEGRDDCQKRLTKTPGTETGTETETDAAAVP